MEAVPRRRNARDDGDRRTRHLATRRRDHRREPRRGRQLQPHRRGALVARPRRASARRRTPTRAAIAASQFRIVVPDNGLNWRAVKADLGRALAHRLAIEARLAERARTYRRRRRTQAAAPGPPSVVFDDEASGNATVIVVRAVDQDRHPAPHLQGARRTRPRHPPRHRADDRDGGRRHVLRTRATTRW